MTPNTWTGEGWMATLPAWQTSWWFLGGLLACLGAVGFALWRSRHLRLGQERAAQEALSRWMQESREKERRRIASELHDSLGQDLLIIKNRSLLALAATREAEAVVAQLEEISRVAAHAVEEVRRVAYRLGTHHLEHLGLTQALATMVEQVAASAGMRVESRIEAVDDLLDGEGATSLYRIAQEALNNVVKHADARQAWVRLERDVREIRLVVRDDGCGFDAARRPQGSFGLFDMAERARLLGGELQLASNPGGGAEVQVRVPIPEERAVAAPAGVAGKSGLHLTGES